MESLKLSVFIRKVSNYYFSIQEKRVYPFFLQSTVKQSITATENVSFHLTSQKPLFIYRK